MKRVLVVLFFCALGLTGLTMRDELQAPIAAPIRSAPATVQAPKMVAPIAEEDDDGDDTPAPPASAPTSACTPDASAHCSAGVLFAFDSCSKPGEVLDDCGGRGCIDDACLLPAVGPSCPPGLSEIGVCEDNTLAYCLAGVVRRVDCTALGRTCGHGLDGEAACLPPSPKPCALLPALGRCDGHTASICQGGKLSVRTCPPDSHCSTEGGAHCETVVRFRTQLEATGGCSLCGCNNLGPAGAEVCDGFDNDRDGQVDNGAACLAVPIRAVVVRDGFGQPSATTAQITAEIAAVNAVFNVTGHDTGVHFSLGETVIVDRPSWISADDTTVDEAFADPAVQGTAFAVPVVFTQRLESGGKEHPGVSTLPDGTCADLDLPHAPDNGAGVIVIAHNRYETTLAHELGHYFGLCHTHQPTIARDVLRHDTDTASFRCAECLRTGDGICDTPIDPGTGICTVEGACTAHCTDGQLPDANNVMSYYTSCRSRFSAEQTMQMHRYLARRIAWRTCGHNPASCPCNSAAPCASGMMLRCDPVLAVCVPS